MSTPTARHAEPQPIPTPPDFPVRWERPEDARYFWTPDRMHFPDVVTPLDAAIVGDIHNRSFNVPMAALGMPVRMHFMVANGRAYTSMAPVVSSPEEMEAAERRVQERVGPAMGSLGEHWQNDLLPEIKRHLEWWESLDLRGADVPTLLGYFDETWSRMLRCWEIHFEDALPMLMSMSLFDELYRDMFGGDGAFASYRLLQGLDNKSVEAGRALWRLSRQALAEPEVRRVLQEESADDVLAALEASDAGRAFLADFQAYLDEFGRRGDKFAINAPTWIEDSRPAIRMLKDYVAQVGDDPETDQAELAAERERLIAQARERLKGYPQQAAEQFEFLLRAAQVATRLQEDHNYWIDQLCMYQVRRVIMELGRRFAAAGALDTPGDVFYLTPDEIRGTGRDLAGADLRDLVARRKADEARYQSMQPAPALGTMPPGPPPDNPLFRAAGKFWGPPPQPSEEPGTLRGGAGSPGKARGTVKVIRSLREADLARRR